MVNDWGVFGHWESDTIFGHGDSDGIHTTLERQSRFFDARKLDHITASDIVSAQTSIYATLPAPAVASITVDNGLEFAHHQQLADMIGVPTYFCDPYSSWQRGSNEHFNGRVFADIYPKEPGSNRSYSKKSTHSSPKSTTGPGES